MPDLCGLILEVGMPETELVKWMREMRKFRETHEDPIITAAIYGFDDDPRELYEIPEVKTFAAKLIDLGFISQLDAMPNPELRSGPLCALHIWLLAQGKMSASARLDGATINAFLKALDTANRIALTVEGRQA
jgi:hypothetical protein